MGTVLSPLPVTKVTWRFPVTVSPVHVGTCGIGEGEGDGVGKMVGGGPEPPQPMVSPTQNRIIQRLSVFMLAPLRRKHARPAPAQTMERTRPRSGCNRFQTGTCSRTNAVLLASASTRRV